MLQQMETRSESHWHAGRRAGEEVEGCGQKWEEKYKSDVLETRAKAISGRGELVVWSAVGRNY